MIVKQFEISGGFRRVPLWVRLSAAGVLTIGLAACGGGGSTAPEASAGKLPGAPVGTALIAAAAANPAATNTANNPDQAFALVAAVGAAPVTVQSPPVVNFAVIDAAGKHVPGLQLVNTTSSAAGKIADPDCSQNNVTFAMAKFDGTNWQSLISRQRYDKAPSGKFAVVEGTTDPKPTAANTTITKADGSTSKGQYVNPATAVADPSTRIVGILEENAAGGYYTYRFATDVVTPLAMSAAVDVRNVSTGKVANNGNVAVKDSKTIHRLGAQLCYTDPVTKAKVVVNPILDFTLDTNGVATPVKAADGTIGASRKVVDKASCNGCHAPLAAHGTRVDPNYCVICHNAGSTDYNTNNPIDLKNMAHKLHAGKNLLTKDYKIVNLVFKATATTKTYNNSAKTDTYAVTGTAFPQDVRNCATCHDNKVAPQADNWKTAPSRSACGSCHDGIDFATGQGLTLADAAKGATSSPFGHIGGSQADDTKCSGCHKAADIPIYHAAAVKTARNQTLVPGVSEIAYEIGSVTLNASKQPVIRFKMVKDGAPVTSLAIPTTVVNTSGVTVVSPTYEPIAGFAGGPSFYVAYAVPQDGVTAPADFNARSNVSLANLLVACVRHHHRQGHQYQCRLTDL